eukprot:227739-Rhodomonas_salina.1
MLLPEDENEAGVDEWPSPTGDDELFVPLRPERMSYTEFAGQEAAEETEEPPRPVTTFGGPRHSEGAWPFLRAASCPLSVGRGAPQ